MKRLLRLTALALGLTLLLSACGHKNTEPERKDAATQTVPVEGITGLTLCDGDVTLRFEKDEEGSWIWHDDPTFPLEQSAMDELLARLRVLTRKKGSGSTNVYTLADLTVDTAARTAKRGGRTLELSAREYALLEYLIRSKGVVLSRQQIEDNLWSLDYAGGTNVVDVYISYLRKKLELSGERKLLHTVRGMGWVLKEDA